MSLLFLFQWLIDRNEDECTRKQYSDNYRAVDYFGIDYYQEAEGHPHEDDERNLDFRKGSFHNSNTLLYYINFIKCIKSLTISLQMYIKSMNLFKFVAEKLLLTAILCPNTSSSPCCCSCSCFRCGSNYLHDWSFGSGRRSHCRSEDDLWRNI